MPGVTTAYQAGVHGSRPAANAGCILYSCSTHGLVYRSDGTTWTTWLTLPSGVASATPALTFGTAAAQGAASTYVATDATLPIFDATVPAGVGPAAAAGSAGVAARRDHSHGFASGTAFPGSPATNDLYYRTNILGGTLFKYDGTRWRSMQTFSRTIEIDNLNFSVDTPSTGLSVNQEAGWAGIPFAGTYDVYCLSAECVVFNNSTSNGGNFWTVTLYKRTPAQAATALGNFVTSGDTTQLATAHSIAVNAVIASAASTHTYWGLNPNKTGAPGNLWITAEVFYQIIAT